MLSGEKLPLIFMYETIEKNSHRTHAGCHLSACPTVLLRTSKTIGDASLNRRLTPQPPARSARPEYAFEPTRRPHRVPSVGLPNSAPTTPPLHTSPSLKLPTEFPPRPPEQTPLDSPSPKRMFVPIWLARETGDTCTVSAEPLIQLHLNRRRFSAVFHLSAANRFAMYPFECLATSGQKTGQTVTKSRSKQDKIRTNRDRHLS